MGAGVWTTKGRGGLDHERARKGAKRRERAGVWTAKCTKGREMRERRETGRGFGPRMGARVWTTKGHERARNGAKCAKRRETGRGFGPRTGRGFGPRNARKGAKCANLHPFTRRIIGSSPPRVLASPRPRVLASSCHQYQCRSPSSIRASWRATSSTAMRCLR